MKKLLAFILAAALTLSLVACGGGGKDSAPEDVEYPTIGDTVSTDKAEFVLQSFEFAESICNDHYNLDAYMKPSSGEFDYAPKVADKDKVFVCIEFTLKNIGKTPLDEYSVYSNGNIHSSLIADYIQIDYNGYLFGFDNGSDIGRFNFVDDGKGSPIMDIDILGDAREIRGYLTVAMEAMTETDNPVLLNVQLPNENGDIEIMTYKIR